MWRTGIPVGENGISGRTPGANRDMCLMINRYMSLARGQDG